MLGALSGGVAGGIGGIENIGNLTRGMMHGVTQGAISKAGGGRFGDGALGAFASSMGGGLVGRVGPGPGQAMVAAAVGGTASVIGGGKFANGAISRAMVNMFNDQGKHSAGERSLTAGERTLGEFVFGTSIDYDSVRIIEGKYSIFQGSDVTMAPNGNIYAPTNAYRADYSLGDVATKGLFIHEMAHVLQHQEGINVRWAGLKIAMSGGYLRGNISRTYGVTYQANYLRVNIEQQAELWRMLYLDRRAMGAAP